MRILHRLITKGCLSEDVRQGLELGLRAGVLADQRPKPGLKTDAAGVQLLDVLRDRSPWLNRPESLKKLVKASNSFEELVLLFALLSEFGGGRRREGLNVVDGENSNPAGERASPPLIVRPADDLNRLTGLEGELGRVRGRISVKRSNADRLLEWRRLRPLISGSLGRRRRG